MSLKADDWQQPRVGFSFWK